VLNMHRCGTGDSLPLSPEHAVPVCSRAASIESVAPTAAPISCDAASDEDGSKLGLVAVTPCAVGDVGSLAQELVGVSSPCITSVERLSSTAAPILPDFASLPSAASNMSFASNGTLSPIVPVSSLPVEQHEAVVARHEAAVQSATLAEAQSVTSAAIQSMLQPTQQQATPNPFLQQTVPEPVRTGQQVGLACARRAGDAMSDQQIFELVADE